MANCHTKREMGVEASPMVGVHFIVYHFSESYPILSLFHHFTFCGYAQPTTPSKNSGFRQNRRVMSAEVGIFRSVSPSIRSPPWRFCRWKMTWAARRLQRRPSIFFLTDESWVSIFCGMMISDRGMITYSNFIVGIPMSTGAFLPFLSFFLR